MMDRKLSLKAALRLIHGEERPRSGHETLLADGPWDEDPCRPLTAETIARLEESDRVPDVQAFLADLEAFPELAPPPGVTPLTEEDVAAEWRAFEMKLNEAQKERSPASVPVSGRHEKEPRATVHKLAAAQDGSGAVKRQNYLRRIGPGFFLGFAAAALLCGLLTAAWTLTRSDRWDLSGYSPVIQDLFPRESWIVRGGDEIPVVAVPAQDPSFILSLGVVGFDHHRALEIQLSDGEGHVLRRFGNLVSRNGMLTLVLPTAPFKSGNYELHLFTDDGRSPAADYRFRLELLTSE